MAHLGAFIWLSGVTCKGRRQHAPPPLSCVCNEDDDLSHKLMHASNILNGQEFDATPVDRD